MATGTASPILRFIRSIRAGAARDAPDEELLTRFVADRDEAAFAALVHRHGAMVLGVCRRVLRDADRAEDAFQATFLVLVRKAASIGRPGRLGNWLYGVAYRTALKARGRRDRLWAREKPLVDVTPAEAAVNPADREELLAALDEELHRLPERYRSPVVLCYLQGKTREEAARTLGCPRETLATRLLRARERLRGRLARRGVGLSGSLFAAALSPSDSLAAVPHALVDATVRGAVSSVSTSAASAALARAVAWIRGVAISMSATKLKVVTVATLTLMTAGLGAGVVVCGDRVSGEPAQRKEGAASPPGGKDADPAKGKEARRGEPLPAYLGIALRRNEGAGPVVVYQVIPGGPADRAGLQDEDVILKVGTVETKDRQAFFKAVAGLKPGEKVTLRVRRDGKQTSLRVTVGKRPAEGGRKQTPAREGSTVDPTVN
jgi:RNA polymerase sigma factor (sigma-70 family)